MTVKFRTTVATRVWPFLDDYAGGGWNIGVPHGYKGQLVKAMEPAKATATITRVDNTTPRPSEDPDNPCPPPSKRGCGTFTKKATARVYGGHRPRHISLHAGIGLAGGDCLIGDARTFDDTRALVGGNREGNMLVRMPKASAFRRPVVRLKGRTRKRSSFGDPGESSTNDVTREVTVTFRRR